MPGSYRHTYRENDLRKKELIYYKLKYVRATLVRFLLFAINAYKIKDRL